MMSRSGVLACALFVTLCCVSAATAQIDPDDTGAGTKLGMAEQNNSGEAGTVTLFRHGEAGTLLVIHLESEPPGRPQPAHIHRGHSCDTLDPKPAFGLAPVVNGYSRTIVAAPESKLLSGNYVVNVHWSPQHIEHYVSCGELYQS